MIHKTDNLRITDINPIDSPDDIFRELPMLEDAAVLVESTRNEIHKVLHDEDDRLIVIVGPCSIHDLDSALEYAEKLKPLKARYQNELLIVMRVYFEKPRTRIGWKGLINDPNLNNSFDINKGVRLARKLLLDVNKLGVPAATEFLDIVTGQYYADLISWGAIGARTTESQVHRELASGLSCPVGFKNGTDGNLTIACDAIIAAGEPHIFLSPTKQGKMSIFTTTGNDDTHVILRGGYEPNYTKPHVEDAVTMLKDNKANSSIMIDLSHANSQKQFKRQVLVGQNVADQIAEGNPNIKGVMIESHLHEGNQKLQNETPLEYGKSITDACLAIEDTADLLEVFAGSVKQRRTGM